MLLGLTPELPAAASLERFEAQIMDQGRTGSCTGHGTSQGLVVAFASKGAPLDFVPSQLMPYQVGRAAARAERASTLPSLDKFPPLADEGAMPADVMAGITLWGIRPMGPLPTDGRFSDVTPDNVNDEPQLGELEAGAATLVVGEFRIDELAGDVCDQVARAIAGGVPVGIGTFVDEPFEMWTPGTALPGIPNTNDPNGGGHWFLITSYRTATTADVDAGLVDQFGAPIFRGPNSWGPTWGDGGHWEANADFIRSAWDLYPFTVRKVTT